MWRAQPEAVSRRVRLKMAENIIFFINVLVFSFLHECAHGFAARVLGGCGRMGSRGVFGNVMYLEPGLPAGRRLAVYLSGPAFNLAAAAAGLSLMYVMGGTGRFLSGGTFLPAPAAGVTPAFFRPALSELRMAVYANIMLAAFNLLPFYPLDGGRAALLFLSGITGQRVSAAAACVFSVLFAVSVFILGLYLVQYNIMNIILVIDAFYFLYIFAEEINEIL